MDTLSARQARAIALRAQGFGDRELAKRCRRDPAALLDHLGAIQLDSVSVVVRPQDVVPFSRTGSYDVLAMYDAVYAQRRGFEYWGHEASWLPMAEYRYFLPRMAKFREADWWQRRMEEFGTVAAEVLERIRRDGPVVSADFADTRPERRGGLGTLGLGGNWWDRKPAKQALEILFAAGELMCARRTAGFARVYDLPERVLPAGVDTTDPGEPVAVRHLLRRAIAAMGIATGPEAARYYVLHRHGAKAWRPALADLLASGEVVEVAVEGWRVPGLAVPAALEGPLRVPAHRPTFLSPFDNLIWERDRIERLFGFRYRIEIYTRAPEREYGYYVLPLLARGQLQGRADCKLERKASVLRVLALYLEGAEPEDAAAALRDLAAHLGVSSVAVERCEPAAMHDVISRMVPPCHR
jgi:uncharacterized protein